MGRFTPILSVCLLLTLASAAKGQTPVTCGIIDIDGPSEVAPDTPLVLKAKVTSLLHTSKPEFKWTVSAGTIMKGQGTDEITVDTDGLRGVELVATVELSGAPLGCKASASRTTYLETAAIACGMPFDRYGDIKFEDEKARLDNFSIQLSHELLATGYIVMWVGRETFEGEAAERLARARSYLSQVGNIDPIRVVTVDCGFSDELRIHLRILPLGVTFTECDSVIQIPLTEVRFTKKRPKASKKLH